MRIHSSEAIILRHLDYGEADRIVTFLTPEQGRRKGFARGARKSRRRFGPALEPFARVRLTWSEARGGDLIPLRDAELIDLRAGLRSDLGAIALAGYGCELVEELLGEGQGHQGVWDLLQAYLDHLAAAGFSPEARLLFELRILAQAGYAPHLLHCSACGGGFGKEEVRFDPSLGGSLCLACAPPSAFSLGVPTLGTLGRILQGPPNLFDGFRLSPRTLSEGGEILSRSLRLHLHRPLRTLRFLEESLGGGSTPGGPCAAPFALDRTGRES